MEYRELKQGETIEAGDEYLDVYGWRQCEYIVGEKLDVPTFRVRRLVAPVAPVAFSLPCFITIEIGDNWCISIAMDEIGNGGRWFVARFQSTPDIYSRRVLVADPMPESVRGYFASPQAALDAINAYRGAK